jgi:transcriptional regulator with XRE-family HTH domain
MPLPEASQPRPIVDSATLFGRCLATVRKDLGLTQGEFAKAVGITRPGLTRLETGRSTPSFYLLMRLGQRVHPRSGADAASIIALVYMAATALRRQGVRVVNRPRSDGDLLLDQARLDRVIGAVFDREFRERALVDAFEYDDDADGTGA